MVAGSQLVRRTALLHVLVLYAHCQGLQGHLFDPAEYAQRGSAPLQAQ